MRNFGKIFKKFRESRGLRLKDVARAGISMSQLSRFEKGDTDLTITKFMSILDEINMSIDEFMYAVHDFHRDELNEILSKIRYYISIHDVEGLKKLLYSQMELENSRGKFQQINIILLKIRLQDLSGESYYTKDDLSYLSEYLFSVEYWGYYELLIFMNTLDALKHEAFMVLAKEMSRRSDFYREIPNNRRLISTMLLNAYITCIERNELIDALYFEKQLNQCFFIETEIYERLIFQYAQNLYKYKKNEDIKAVIEMKKCIAALKLAGSSHIAQTYEGHLEKTLRSR
ncbi:helix-turn-helix domain-containing protein [Streptococcus acidominimus]|uniref:Rgg/GadR/MutR family transcriptional regulator n=1 Tax=Streptococcus acidominimus TaxID=1326 RepID=A0A4Y9FM80_STRAI|nr:Rgg/GadR/MutR family transcriptional regulator [Streptococcus acidominimus]MBF0819790.1 helix-turn-helix domain-containing protein [Streptococcus acidominimus]MBF0839719.1 helix-turn-helix domain-containing protein [Streptococcus acidominimus]MBF0847610.1 helix-turn-helix domain-containing protein [Streptococcus danieliae]TFU29439.1 Rgg/GadR/MutR family transcriptional regulator [Streptococcus acidominimus]